MVRAASIRLESLFIHSISGYRQDRKRRLEADASNVNMKSRRDRLEVRTSTLLAVLTQVRISWSNWTSFYSFRKIQLVKLENT